MRNINIDIDENKTNNNNIQIKILYKMIMALKYINVKERPTEPTSTR